MFARRWRASVARKRSSRRRVNHDAKYTTRNSILIVTIDGPAGAGKSSIARQVAERLGFDFLDTGSLYRAVTLAALRSNIDMGNSAQLVQCADSVQLRWIDCRIMLNGEDVTEAIRSPEVTASIRLIADEPAIRKRLSELQREIASGRNIVTEGRDQGSEVFPDAGCKIFLTASSEVRAQRRQQQLAESGNFVSLDEILAAQNKRDAEDQSRPVGRLRAAADAIVVCTDDMTPDDVLHEILRIVDGAMHEACSSQVE
jgi:CMP/dCMP kinase